MSVLVESVPDGWSAARLTDICDLIPGAATSEDPGGSVPVAKPRNLASGRVTGKTDRMSADEAAQRPRYRIRPGDLLCSRTGTVGNVGLACDQHAGWVFGSGIICARIKPTVRLEPQFLVAYFLDPSVREWITLNSRGTSVPNISSKVLGTLPVSVPPPDVRQRIATALTSLNDKIEAHEQICETTAELRDRLLPLLLSGKLPAA